MIAEMTGLQRRYVDIPFKHMGRTTDGCDCLGLVQIYWKNEHGIDVKLIDEKGVWYSEKYEDCIFNKDDDPRRLEKWLRSLGGFRMIPYEGDIVMFGHPFVDHCGIYLENGDFLNQQRKNGKVVVSNMKDFFMLYRGCIRVPEADNGRH